MSDLIFARSPYTIKHTSTANPPDPAYECFDTNIYGRYADFTGFSVNAAGTIVNGTITDKISGATLTRTATTTTSGATSFPVVFEATQVNIRVTFNLPSGYNASSHTCEIEVTQAAATPTCQAVKLFNFSGISSASNLVYSYTDCSNASQSGTLSGANSTVTINVKFPYTQYLFYNYSLSGVLPFIYIITDNYIAANVKITG